MDQINASRVLMGDSLGFHIIFVMFSLTLPILVLWFEWLGHKKKDQNALDTAYLWAKIMTLLVITGVISGTVIALQMSLVWPGILKFGGKIIGLPFMFETYAFLIEAVFLGLYMATWKNKNVSRKLHLFYGFMVFVGATLSAYTITSVNAWMNLPTGFDIVQGQFQNIDVWRAMFSQTSIIEFIHSMPAYYLAASTLITSIYAIKLLRNKRQRSVKSFDFMVIRRLMAFAAICFVAILITADITGKYLAKHEPEKLAAIEVVSETSSHQPFIFGGIADDDGNIKGPYIKIPNALSILAGNSVNTEVRGLSEVQKDKRPPAYLHTLFDIKLLLAGAIFASLLGFFALKHWCKEWLIKSSSLVLLAVSGTFGIITVELGWMLTEIGRQPWAVKDYVTTAEAVTKSNQVLTYGYIFPGAYVLLFTVTILALRKLIRDHKGSDNA